MLQPYDPTRKIKESMSQYLQNFGWQQELIPCVRGCNSFFTT